MKHLRQEPVDHRLTVKTECGVRAVILLTTDKTPRADCIPCLQAVRYNPNPNPNPQRQTETLTRKEPEMSNTMAESFCEEYLMTGTELGQDYTDWRDGDIFTGSHRLSQASALSLFHPVEEEDHLLIVTVFRGRSWIVQQEPTGGAPPMVRTWEDEHRILDLIHRMLEAGLAPAFKDILRRHRWKQRQKQRRKQRRDGAREGEYLHECAVCRARMHVHLDRWGRIARVRVRLPAARECHYQGGGNAVTPATGAEFYGQEPLRLTREQLDTREKQESQAAPPEQAPGPPAHRRSKTQKEQENA